MLRTLIRPTAFSMRPIVSSLPLRQTLNKPRFLSATRMQFDSVNHKLNTESSVYKYLEQGPKVVKYTNEHEWLAVFDDDSAFIGITKYASEALGDATFVEVPEVGDKVEAGESIGSIESVKSASEIYSPVGGEIVTVNENLESQPGLINEDPIGEGWIAHIKLNDPSIIESSEELLSEEEYENSLQDL